MIYDNLGEKIRELRLKKGLSQESFGFDIGVTRQTITKWENGDTIPSVENLKSICAYFEIDYLSLISELNSNDSAAASDEAKGSTSISAEQQPTVIVQNITNIEQPKKKRKKPLLPLAIISSVLFIISIVATWCISRLVSTTDNGFGTSSNLRLDMSSFVVSLIICVLLFCSTVYLFIRYYLSRKKKVDDK